MNSRGVILTQVQRQEKMTRTLTEIKMVLLQTATHMLELEIGHQRAGVVHDMKLNELGRTERT